MSAPAAELQPRVLAWFAEHGRALPWRRTRDPYAILVSEVMLQQTQVARVVDRWTAWIERWPTAAALAAATRADVLSAWVGLGYNGRALRLREACAMVARDGWPQDLTVLPGVGRYTADAVAALAFGVPVVQVDVNVARVLDRTGWRPPDAPHPRLGEALMELGALVCRARSADCGACPLSAGCASAHAVVFPERARRPRERFEDSDRWVRGRIVAALAGAEALPDGIDPGRLARAEAALVRDGLVVRDRAGRLALPR